MFYWSDETILVFASEIKALVCHPAVPCRMDQEALPAYLTFGYVPTPRTFFEGVRSVPPGQVLVFEEGSAPRLYPYWEPKVPERRTRGRANVPMRDAARAVRAHLSSAVQRRLVADVPIGAFLSGGIDSSSVVALMAGLMDQPVRTFTVGFEDAAGLR